MKISGVVRCSEKFHSVTVAVKRARKLEDMEET